LLRASARPRFQAEAETLALNLLLTLFRYNVVFQGSEGASSITMRNLQEEALFFDAELFAS
jgi:hypothetical protein